MVSSLLHLLPPPPPLLSPLRHRPLSRPSPWKPPPIARRRASLPSIAAAPLPNPPPSPEKSAVDWWSESAKFFASGALVLGFYFAGIDVADAKLGVNKPELLPKEYTTVIDVAGFLSAGQESRLSQVVADVEKDTGFKLRILAQNYPDTPGLAIRDFWQVDDRTIVLVADPTFGNLLNFNVGDSIDLEVPRNFWSRVSGKYGNVFYWKDKGEDASIEAAVMEISSCLREPAGPKKCLQALG